MPKKRKAALDAVTAVFFAVAVLPQLTGIAAHEWLGIVALVALLAHLAARLDALAGLCRAAARRSFLALARLGLDMALFLPLVVCAASGVLVSATVLLTFGLFAPGYFVWDPLHAASAKVLLALVLVHAVNHAGKLMGFLKARDLKAAPRVTPSETRLDKGTSCCARGHARTIVQAVGGPLFSRKTPIRLARLVVAPVSWRFS